MPISELPALVKADRIDTQSSATSSSPICKVACGTSSMLAMTKAYNLKRSPESRISRQRHLVGHLRDDLLEHMFIRRGECKLAGHAVLPSDCGGYGTYWLTAFRAISFCLVSALLRISSAHFNAPLLRDVSAEVIEELKKRGNLRATVGTTSSRASSRPRQGLRALRSLRCWNSSASFVRISSDNFSLVNTSTNGIIPLLHRVEIV
jgi:hypothetical protein